MIKCKKEKLAYATLLALFLSVFTLYGTARGQDHKQEGIFSGYVVSGDSLTGLPGVVVYVPGTKRGTLTTEDGYFTLTVLAGDSVVISALGFKSRFIKIPAYSNSKSFSADIQLEPAVTMLPTVKVIPWATENDLKHALLKLDIPEEPKVNMEFLYIRPTKESILNGPPMDAATNFKYFKQTQTKQRESRFMVPDVVKLFSTGIN